MIKVNWDLDEALVLIDYYLHNGKTSKNELAHLRRMYLKKAQMLGIKHDNKFRNEDGLSMQIGVIEHIFTDGAKGFSNTGKIFIEAYNLRKKDIDKFNYIVGKFYENYL